MITKNGKKWNNKIDYTDRTQDPNFKKKIFVIEEESFESRDIEADIKKLLSNDSLTKLDCSKEIVNTIENEEIKGKKLNLNDLSFDIEPHPLPKGLIPSLIGLFFLLLSLFGSIMNLPSYLMLKEQSIYVKIVWKHIVMTSIFSPFMILDLATSDIFIISVIVDNISSLITLSIISTLYNYLVYYAVTNLCCSHSPIVFYCYYIYHNLENCSQTSF